MKTSDGELIIISGASRSGKTAWAFRRVAGRSRVMVFDPDVQWSEQPGFRRVDGRRALLDVVTTAWNGKFAFVPGVDMRGDFQFWSRAVLHWGTYRGGDLAAVAEELADVTNSSKAPGEWGMLIRRGLKRGISLYPISQRWAEADKTAFGNASGYALFSAASVDDMRYLARKTRVSLEEMERLVPEYWDGDPARPKRLPMIEVGRDGSKSEHAFEFTRGKRMTFR